METRPSPSAIGCPPLKPDCLPSVPAPEGPLQQLQQGREEEEPVLLLLLFRPALLVPLPPLALPPLALLPTRPALPVPLLLLPVPPLVLPLLHRQHRKSWAIDSSVFAEPRTRPPRWPSSVQVG